MAIGSCCQERRGRDFRGHSVKALDISLDIGAIK